ncbi:uncharacterized protein [Primulina huaijiensis]|uniref:uncharacterized protein n=1 Tax=Primulina huaijiensis TaxID=1492673 RepID=UPI003CC731F0
MACTIDFRCLDEGFGGKTLKRKRSQHEAEKLQLLHPSLDEADMDLDHGNPPPSKKQAVPSSSDPNMPSSFGRPTYDGVIAGKLSGRKWKEVRTHRASQVHVSRKAKVKVIEEKSSADITELAPET